MLYFILFLNFILAIQLSTLVDQLCTLVDEACFSLFPISNARLNISDVSTEPSRGLPGHVGPHGALLLRHASSIVLL